MFIPLEGQDVISITRVVAMVRTGEFTTLFLRDGSTVKSGFRPETLTKRYNGFCKEARAEAATLCGRMGGKRA